MKSQTTMLCLGAGAETSVCFSRLRRSQSLNNASKGFSTSYSRGDIQKKQKNQIHFSIKAERYSTTAHPSVNPKNSESEAGGSSLLGESSQHQNTSTVIEPSGQGTSIEKHCSIKSDVDYSTGPLKWAKSAKLESTLARLTAQGKHAKREYLATQADLGYPNLKKAFAVQASHGYPNLGRGRTLLGALKNVGLKDDPITVAEYRDPDIKKRDPELWAKYESIRARMAKGSYASRDARLAETNTKIASLKTLPEDDASLFLFLRQLTSRQKKSIGRPETKAEYFTRNRGYGLSDDEIEDHWENHLDYIASCRHCIQNRVPRTKLSQIVGLCDHQKPCSRCIALGVPEKCVYPYNAKWVPKTATEDKPVIKQGRRGRPKKAVAKKEDQFDLD